MVLPRLTGLLFWHTAVKFTAVSKTLLLTTKVVVLASRHPAVTSGVKVSIKEPGPEAAALKLFPVKNGLPDHVPFMPPCVFDSVTVPSAGQVVSMGFCKGTGPPVMMTTSEFAGKAHTVPVGENVIL